MGPHRAIAAEVAKAEVICRTPSIERPTGAHRDTVRAALGHSLEDAATGDGLQLGDYLLAAAQILAAPRRLGSKLHLLTDAQGIPLSLILTGANRHDVTQLLPLVSVIPPVAGMRGAPRRKPALIQADRAYHSDPLRRLMAGQGIGAQIAKRGTPHGSGLGKTRWVVERTIAWLHQFRRLRVRYERLPSMHEAFLKLGACIICWRFLKAA